MEFELRVAEFLTELFHHSLVGSRYLDIKHLKKEINSLVNNDEPVEFEDLTDYENLIGDFCLGGTVKYGEHTNYIKVYYIKDRQNHLFITKNYCYYY